MRRSFFHAAPLIATFACAGHPPAMAPAASPPPRLYVSDEASGAVTMIDTLEGRAIGTFQVGKRPRGMRLTADGKRLYVAVSGSAASPPGSTVAPPPPDRSADGVVEIETATGRILRVLPAGNDPENLALTPDGSRIVVSNEEDGEASVIDLVHGKRVGALPTGAEPEGVGCRPDGKVCYVTSEDEGTVTVLDPLALKVLATFPAGQRPRAVIFTSDGRWAFVSAEQSRTVTLVDAQRHAVAGTLRIDGPQVKPMGLALSHDERTLYVSNGRGGSITAIDIERFAITATFTNVGQRPWGIAVSRDSQRLFTANGPSNDVSVVQLPGGALLQHIPAGEHPWGLALFDP